MAGAALTYTPLDLDALRTALSAGRTVRVGVLPTGQFPAGTAGRVRAVGAPDTDGPEFIQVELTVGGAKDVVPFAPADLSPLRRGQSAPEPLPGAATRRPGHAKAGVPKKRGATPGGATPTAELSPLQQPTSSVVAGTVPQPADCAATARPSRPHPATAHPVAEAHVDPRAGDADAGGADGTAPAASSTPSVNEAATPTQRSKPATTPAAAPPAGDASAIRPRRTPSPRRASGPGRQPVAVTLSTAEPDHMAWTVQVTVGSRTVVKPTPVPPSQAWALVTGLGHPEVEQLVAGALAEHRRLAQDRADRLARELAEAQAELAAYPAL
jgi:hypothetical protein